MDQKIYKIIFSFKIFIAIILMLAFLSGTAQAATLYFQPPSANVTVGDLVTVKLLVNTQGKFINNSDGTIQFPTDSVEVISINSKNSIFSLWVEQPSFSNTLGSISFNGGVPNPGYVGTGGEVLSVIFRAKKAGTASLLLGSAAVRENDGLGTDILTSKLAATINIVNPATAPANQNENNTSLLSPAVISSSVYTNQDYWYPDKSGTLKWKLPADTTSIQTLINNSSNSVPVVSYDPPIYQKEVKNLTDGIWYFHLRYFVGDKSSEISHYKIQIDSEKPKELNVTSIKNSDGTVSLNLSAKDSLSGVDYYEIAVDGQSVIKVSAQTAKNPVLLSQLKTGDNKILVTVYDKAGNKEETTIEETIEVLPPPIIKNYPQKIKLKERIQIIGESIYPQSTVRIIIGSNGNKNIIGAGIVNNNEKSLDNSYDVLTDKYGNFSFISEPITSPGNYQIWAYAIMQNGVNSLSSVKLNIIVENSLLDNILSNIDFPYLRRILIPFFIGLAILVIIIFSWYRNIILMRRLALIQKKENQELALLIKNAAKQISILEKARVGKKITIKEEKAMYDLKALINKIKDFNKYEIK